MSSVAFGSFDAVCSAVTLPLCPLVGGSLVPACYSRNIEIGASLLFEPATLVIHLVALVMTLIMILNVKSKYTAVGRSEMLWFLIMYAITTGIEFLVLSGVIATATDLYPYFVAAHTAFMSATFWSLLFNGFVGFQFIEDGSPLSVWSLRISSMVIFAVSYTISIGTFLGRVGLSRQSPMALFILYFGFNGLCTLLFIGLQVGLVLTTLEDRWPLVDLAFGSFFFALGQVIEYVLSVPICDLAKHYVDGLFFGTICSLLAIMMVYKFWDGITKEDLEFSVGGKLNTWEIKDPLLNNDSMAHIGKANGYRTLDTVPPT